MSEEWRTFCAIELPEQVRVRLQDRVKRPENIHLTLKFFGNVDTKKLPRISDTLARVAKEFSSFSISIGGTGVFPNPRRTQVLWIGVQDPSGKLSELQRRIEDECAKEGFEKENRAYRPHLTIARIRRPEGARELTEAHLNTKFSETDVDVTEFVLFRSELSPKGSRYTPISRHELV